MRSTKTSGRCLGNPFHQPNPNRSLAGLRANRQTVRQSCVLNASPHLTRALRKDEQTAKAGRTTGRVVLTVCPVHGRPEHAHLRICCRPSVDGPVTAKLCKVAIGGWSLQKLSVGLCFGVEEGPL